jgi:N-acetylmuramoyl-L-alanine amidase
MPPLIHKGQRSLEVADVQARLRALGIEIEDDPGYFGESTQRGVMTFQQRRGLLVDGIVGPHTWADLVATQWRLGDRVIYLTHPLMRGDDVDALQQQLNALGFDAGRQDGIYGIDSDRAVRAFQREYGLREDGLFGPRSCVALTGLRADRPATAAALRDELRRGESAGVHGAFVVLDPGHGGTDRGDRGPSGACEADICWHLAGLVADRLSGAGARVRFTRTETESPDVTERARRANDLAGDVFISLHLNAHTEAKASGASTYYFPTSRSGELLADTIQDQLVSIGFTDCRSHAKAYPILRETSMPAVLLEPGFITNPLEEEQLENPDVRSLLADAIARGVHRFYEEGAA